MQEDLGPWTDDTCIVEQLLDLFHPLMRSQDYILGVLGHHQQFVSSDAQGRKHSKFRELVDHFRPGTFEVGR